MTAPISITADHRALILAPYGRDASVAGTLLTESNIAPYQICPDLQAFQRALAHDVYFAIVAEEAFINADLRDVIRFVREQPSWSDLPFVILTQGVGSRNRHSEASRLFDLLTNVTFLERPFRPMTFASVARSVLKGRLRQFEARSRMDELHESEQMLQTALLAGRLGSWSLDVENRDLTASGVFKELFGRDANDEFTYSDLVESIHPDDRQSVTESICSAAKVGGSYAIEYRTVWPDNSIHWAEVSARLVRNYQRGTHRLVGVSSDITSRKSAEAELRRMNETLEARIAERARQLDDAHGKVVAEIRQREKAEDQLRQTQKVEMIGQLTGGVAHDFNNLLMAIIGNLELLRKRLSNEPRSLHLIEGAMQGAERGAALTQRLLAFARRQELKVEPKNVVEVISEMTDLLQRSVGPQVELDIKLPEQLPLVLVDSNQIELAVLNLVVNSRDAMPEGGIVSIRAEAIEAKSISGLSDGPYVRLTVSDSGHGMDAETLSRATEPFFSTKELGKGTGLGLSMIHGLALQLHGALRLSSTVGQGTSAELWLPVTNQVRNDPVPKLPSVSIEAPATTVLFVDDDALISMSTVAILEDLGHNVIEANSGAEALQILRTRGDVGLLITDYSMPKMTGAQLAKAVRELRPDLPIILATGYAEIPEGVDIDLPRLGKPYHQHQLATQIAAVLGAKQG